MVEDGKTQTTQHVWLDASGNYGCGAFWSPQWLQLRWLLPFVEDCSKRREASITLKELLPVVLAWHSVGTGVE